MSERDNTNDPFAPQQATVLRPRPGAGRRGGPESPSQQGPQRLDPPSSGAPASRSASGSRDGSGRGYREDAASGYRDESARSYRDDHAPPLELRAAGLTPLLQAATPLLVLAGRLRGSVSQPDVGALRRQVLEEIRRFEDRARTSGVAAETVLAARYALCGTLDEAVLSTAWGAQSEWAAQTLLVQLHREARAGEKFFDMLSGISADPARHIDLMELQYACLALGFRGKYEVIRGGEAELDNVRHDLYRRIRAQRGAPEVELSPHWRGVQDRRNPVIRYVPWWVVGALALVVITGAFIYFNTRLGALATPVSAKLANLGLRDFTEPAAAAAPVAGPRLKQLLAADERSGGLAVEENGARTVVTLVAPDLFASGSAKLNPASYETLRHIAAALQRVPGRVMVVGHTDDAPLRSLRYRDNYELSRERALQVVQLLKLSMGNSAQIELTGAGPSQPRYRPESLPENRARNRRVEIIHVGEG